MNIYELISIIIVSEFIHLFPIKIERKKVIMATNLTEAFARNINKTNLNESNEYQYRINTIDLQLVQLLNERMEEVEEMARNGMVLDSNEIISILENEETYTGMVKEIWPSILNFSKYLQDNLDTI